MPPRECAARATTQSRAAASAPRSYRPRSSRRGSAPRLCWESPRPRDRSDCAAWWPIRFPRCCALRWWHLFLRAPSSASMCSRSATSAARVSAAPPRSGAVDMHRVLISRMDRRAVRGVGTRDEGALGRRDRYGHRRHHRCHRGARLHDGGRHVVGGAHGFLPGRGDQERGALCTTWIVVGLAGGPAHVFEAAAQSDRMRFLPEAGARSILAWITASLIIVFGSIPQQDVLQRVMSAKDEAIAARSTLLGGILYFVVASMPIVLVSAALVIDAPGGRAPRSSDGFGNSSFPRWSWSARRSRSTVLFFGALVSAILSTAGGILLAPAVVIAENVIKPFAKLHRCTSRDAAHHAASRSQSSPAVVTVKGFDVLDVDLPARERVGQGGARLFIRAAGRGALLAARKRNGRARFDRRGPHRVDRTRDRDAGCRRSALVGGPHRRFCRDDCRLVTPFAARVSPFLGVSPRLFRISSLSPFAWVRTSITCVHVSCRRREDPHPPTQFAPGVVETRGPGNRSRRNEK